VDEDIVGFDVVVVYVEEVVVIRNSGRGGVRLCCCFLLTGGGEQLDHEVSVDHARILVDLAEVEDIVDLLTVELVSKRHQSSPELVHVDLGLLLLEGADRLSDDLVLITLSGHLGSEHLQEGGEVEGSLDLGQHGIQVVVRHDAADLVEHGPKVGFVDDTVTVPVDDLEAVLEFGHLFL